jgi:hypothetical protein
MITDCLGSDICVPPHSHGYFCQAFCSPIFQSLVLHLPNIASDCNKWLTLSAVKELITMFDPTAHSTSGDALGDSQDSVVTLSLIINMNVVEA